MYPRISDIISDLFGVDINVHIPTYSFFLFLTFTAGAITIYFELKRKENEGVIEPQSKKILQGRPATIFELLITGLKSFFVGYKLVGMFLYYLSEQGNPANYIFSLKGNWWGGMIFAALFIYWEYRTKQKEKLDEPVWKEKKIHSYHLVGNIFVIAVLCGVVGAKLFNLIDNWEAFMKDPLGIIFSLGGLSFHGGFILAVIVLIIYVNHKKIGWINFIDSGAPGMMLGYAIARIGCQLEGDGCWGIDNLQPKSEWLGFLPDWMWAFKFPHNGLGQGIPLDNCSGPYCFELQNPVFPTSFYEMTICLVLFVILWSIRKKIKIPGMMFSIYLILNGTERVFIELIRVNRQYNVFGIQYSQAQVVSIILIILGLVGILYFRKKKKKGVVRV